MQSDQYFSDPQWTMYAEEVKHVLNMKATFIDKFGHKVILEPLEKQTEAQLRKKAEQIMRKRNIKSELKIEK
jgi:hypothetical protein